MYCEDSSCELEWVGVERWQHWEWRDDKGRSGEYIKEGFMDLATWMS